MGKREEERRQADRLFEEIRRATAKQSDGWLCAALQEIPHRKWLEIEKDVRVAVGILAHQAAARIESLHLQIEKLAKIAEGGCPTCGEKDLHTALIDGKEGLSCGECSWGMNYESMRMMR